MTVHQLIAGAAARHAGRTALVDGPTGAGVTYGELWRRVERIASWLHGRGVRHGDCVALWTANHPAMAAFALGAMRCGAAVTTLNPAVTDREAAEQLADAHAAIAMVSPGLVDRALALDLSTVVAIGDAPGAAPLRDLLAHDAPPPTVEVDAGSPALIPYSSGTTGLPKGVVLMHANLVAVSRQLAHAFDAKTSDATLAVAPFFHILGMTAELLMPLSVGATVVTEPRFDQATFVDLLERHRISFLAVPPPIAAFLVHDPNVPARDLSHLELIAVGGAPLARHIHEALAVRLPRAAIGQGWGLTESSGAISVPRRRTGAPIGTVGAPLRDTELRVVSPDTHVDVRSDLDGELWVRGPQVMRGYLDRPDATAATITADGWLRTGDLGRITSDGHVVIVDRLKELIKVNGFQVAPAELEAVLAAHPAVADAAVAGRPDARTGEAPVALVVAARRVEVDELSGWMRERVAPYKMPVEFRMVDALPRTASGKLQRQRLREMVNTPSRSEESGQLARAGQTLDGADGSEGFIDATRIEDA